MLKNAFMTNDQLTKNIVYAYIFHFKAKVYVIRCDDGLLLMQA